jgi:MFS family permease
MVLAFVSDFYTMAALRVLNGACVGLMIPISQSMVAEEAAFAERGFNFGLLEFGNRAIGQLAASVIVTSISNQLIFGIEGWRLAFFAIAFLSLALALVVWYFMEEKPRQWNPDNIGLMVELQKFAGYFRITTFVVIVAQGMIGTIPGAALQFATMYFQYLGMADAEAAVAFSMFVLGGGLGALLGGIIGDRLAVWSPDHGRPLTAQMSVFMGIPFVAMIFTIDPSRGSMLLTFSTLMFMLGLLSSWCATGCNKPIFLQIVPSGSRGSAMAWEFCLEHTSGHVIGPLTVAFVSQHFFGYTTTEQSVADMPPEVRQQNADALGKSLTISTVIPWILCFVIYGFLHFAYKYDIRPEALLEKESDEIDTGNPNEVP